MAAAPSRGLTPELSPSRRRSPADPALLSFCPSGVADSAIKRPQTDFFHRSRTSFDL